METQSNILGQILVVALTLSKFKSHFFSTRSPLVHQQDTVRWQETENRQSCGPRKIARLTGTCIQRPVFMDHGSRNMYYMVPSPTRILTHALEKCPISDIGAIGHWAQQSRVGGPMPFPWDLAHWEPTPAKHSGPPPSKTDDIPKRETMKGAGKKKEDREGRGRWWSVSSGGGATDAYRTPRMST